ncbi:hypothetical protein AGMMS50239_15090 [Bacteroidia bacterium]|nr:hypothetical protein AGMMS50239_15090 [Bacteroidia bacterium]
MKYKYFLYIASLFMAFLFSCEKEIEFKGDEVKTKLVLNSILTPDSVVKIHLTESRFFLNNERVFKEINNATVELWKDGNKIENLSNAGSGYYTGTYIPKEGDNLRITASCQGFDPVECSTEIVIPSPVISVDTMNFREDRQYSTYYDGNAFVIDSSVYYQTINFDMDITFKDPTDIANYYALNLYLKIYFSTGDSTYYPIGFNSDDMVFQQTSNEMGFLEDDRNYLRSNLFSDELLDGKEYKLKVKAYNIGIGKNPYAPEYENPDVIGKEVFVELQSLSPSYYRFRKTREAGYNVNDIMEYFTEPVQIYSNVKGGIGILGSYSSSVYHIPLK